jgi:hypothetical protein
MQTFDKSFAYKNALNPSVNPDTAPSGSVTFDTATVVRLRNIGGSDTKSKLSAEDIPPADEPMP